MGELASRSTSHLVFPHRFDPALMKELMIKGQQAQREKEGRRGKPMVSEARQAYLANVLVVQREQGLR